MSPLRIGVHPSNTSLFALSRRGTLEDKLDVSWVPVTGTGTGQALGDNEIDLTGTGSTPPLAALAAGVDVVYLAISDPRPQHGSLVVRAESPITTLADLRGAKIGLAIGSYQSTLLVEALDRAGLTWSDVDAVLARDGHGAREFEAGRLDAWIGGDPHLADVQTRVAIRELVPTAELISNRSVWFARRDVVQERFDDVATVLRALQTTDAWIASHPAEAAELFAREVDGDRGLDVVSSWETALRRRPWGLRPIDDEYVAEQQRAADLLAANGQLPARITVADAVVPELGTLVAGLEPVEAGV